VLFVNAIRRDVPSGGNTCSDVLRERLHALADVHELDLGPDALAWAGRAGSLLFVLASLPAALFILLLRRTGRPWLEFFIRLSPWLALRCLVARWRHRPEVVVFNQHASFPYLCMFSGTRRVLVWHDVPSRKRDEALDLRGASRRCAALEHRFARASEAAITFSFSDARYLRRLLGTAAGVLPVVEAAASPRRGAPRPDRLLLVGNWQRAENSDGALRFFEQLALTPAPRRVSYRVAGTGSAEFVARLAARSPALAALPIESIGRYGRMSDFDDLALLAPLARGAGIKLKTVEAWCAGIPVIGTPQAFTGLGPSIWRRGGLRVRSVEDLARLCGDPDALRAACASLEPRQAFDVYQAAVTASGLP